MAKSKYTPEIIDIIVDAIAVGGSDITAIRAAGVSKDTFYRWLNEHKDFSDRVKQAKQEWSESRAEAQIRQAQKAFNDYLHGRMERVLFKREIGTSELGTYEKETTQRIPVGVPRWAIERVLGERVHEIDALQTLVEAGWLPRWVIKIAVGELNQAKQTIREVFNGILPDSESKRVQPGLSKEFAARIRAEILGLKSEDFAPLPEGVDCRPIADQGLREVTADRD